MSRPTPRQQAPNLSFPLLAGEQWNLTEQNPSNFNLIIFYRGRHCPVCKWYLQQLQSLLPDFKKRGVNVVALSMDSQVRARKTKMDWELHQLALGYDLDVETAKNWGLYFSNAIREGEPKVFCEPGFFLTDQNHVVYYAAINSNPWGRPYLPSILKAIDYILENNYPARGELVDL